MIACRYRCGICILVNRLTTECFRVFPLLQSLLSMYIKHNSAEQLLKFDSTDCL